MMHCSKTQAQVQVRVFHESKRPNYGTRFYKASR
jgi:hypothetical protein